MATYLKEMNKYEPAFTYNGVAVQGWQSAALLADAVKAAGQQPDPGQHHQHHQQLHQQHQRWLSTVTNWATGPHHDHLPDLQRLRPGQGQEVRARTNRVFDASARASSVFVCLNQNAKDPVPVPAPAGTPGG